MLPSPLSHFSPRRKELFSKRWPKAVALAAAVVVAIAITGACSGVKSGAGTPPRVMLIGDSVGTDLADPLAAEFGARGHAFKNGTQPGCSALRGLILFWDDTMIPWAPHCDGVIWLSHQENLDSFRPDVVLLHGISETFYRNVDGVIYHPMDTPEGDAMIWRLLEEKWGQVRGFGAQLYFVLNPPPNTSAGQAGCGGAGSANPCALDVRTAHLNSMYRAFAESHPGVGIVDLAAWHCPGGIPCPSIVDGVDVRPDGVHWGSYGAAWAARLIVNSVLVQY